jgi:hypothetical protein
VRVKAAPDTIGPPLSKLGQWFTRFTERRGAAISLVFELSGSEREAAAGDAY